MVFSGEGQKADVAITGTTLLLGTAYVIVNFLVDLAQAWADPRIRTV